MAPYSFYNNKTWHFGNSLAADSTLVGETETRCSPHQMTSCGSAGASFSLFSCSPWHSDVKVQTIGGPGGSEQAACAIERSLSRSICSHPSTGHACQRRPAGTETPLVATELPLSSLSAFTRCNLVHGTDRDSLRGLPPGPCTYRTAGRKVPPLQEADGCFCLMWEETRGVIQKSLTWFCRWLQSLSPSPLRSHCSPVWILTTYTGQRRRAALRWLLFFAGAVSHVPLALFSEKKKNFPHSAGC